jgi:hypothetical protein
MKDPFGSLFYFSQDVLTNDMPLFYWLRREKSFLDLAQILGPTLAWERAELCLPNWAKSIFCVSFWSSKATS